MFRRYVILFFVFVILAFLFWYSVSLQDRFFEVIVFLKQFSDKNEALAMAIFAGLAMLSAMFSLFTSVPLVPAAIALWGDDATLFLLFSGWFFGALVSYLLGSYAGYPFLKSLPAFKKINYYREKISDRAEFGLVLLFRFALPSEVTGYALGIMRYNFLKYLVATFIAELPFALIAVYAGGAFLSEKRVAFVAIAALALVFVGAAIYLFHRRLKKGENNV